MDSVKLHDFKNRKEWRKWLARHHDKESEAWLIHYKKGSGKQRLLHAEAVEEALCYGWIDGQLRSVDKDKFSLRYSPRRKGSVWSGINKSTAQELIESGQMTKAGMEKIEEAKKNGRWASAYSSKRNPTVPEDLRNALSRSRSVSDAFDKLASSQQLQYVFWVDTAKKAETRNKRIDAVVKIMQKGRKPGNQWWKLEARD